ncbi:ABC transporter permease [Companilactobacillus nuruki]|uniref:ABC3 transporter permease C-terminal domain-containing protein n=1 Tax=Companilactobacillus nuruki TaxID=1993540 RepID=A0A2N7AVT5_9LACO|nr:ABC transporter permease [Companilactobacillus nuruki]PMD72296.1 hypothetical protein CBP76_03935 [Companilactobacillus nuruki]
MKSLFDKSSYKNIVSTMGRYISLVLVSFLGAGMLAGLLAIAPDMQTTADDYLRDQDTSDVQIQSPFGFSKSDLSKIKSTKNVSQSQTTTTFDGVAKVAKSSYTMRVYSIPNVSTDLNKLSLVKGHLPTKSNEAVIVIPPDGIKNIKLSNSVSFSGNDTAGLTKRNQFKIVGIVKSGLYPHNKQGTSSKGSGAVDFVLFVSKSGFRNNTENSIFVKFDNTNSLNSFSNKYEDVVNQDINQIKKFSTLQAKKRYHHLNDNINQQQKGLSDLEQISGSSPQITRLNKSLNKQKNTLKQINSPQWYFETRNQNQGFAIIKSDAQSMKSLATIFPIIFFLVAALVALTSMTRMIDEERTLIGTFKSLGYSDSKITSRYLIYAVSATLIGSSFGIIAGFQGLPRMIWSAYSTQYSLPFIQLNFHWTYAILALSTMLVVIIGITAWTIFKNLQESTAQLLTPKTPPAGKRIFLEKIGSIWKHLSFSQKVTQRNIFLDKKRMLMAVVGVIGSTALLVTGFALQNSAMSFPKEQYQHITKYNMTASISDTDELNNEVRKVVTNKSLVKKSLAGRDESIEVSSNNSGTKKYYINLIVPKESKDLSKFVLLKNNNNNIPLQKKGVVITNNIAKRLRLKVGDKIKGKLLTDYETKNMKVTGITIHIIII